MNGDHGILLFERSVSAARPETPGKGRSQRTVHGAGSNQNPSWQTSTNGDEKRWDGGLSRSLGFAP